MGWKELIIVAVVVEDSLIGEMMTWNGVWERRREVSLMLRYRSVQCCFCILGGLGEASPFWVRAALVNHLAARS